MAKVKCKAVEKKTKPQEFFKSSTRGEIGPYNRQDYKKVMKNGMDGDADDNGIYGKNDHDADNRRRKGKR